jgi:ABC-2 type transport system ATP-binding protein
MIKITQLTKRYGRRLAVDGFDFTARPGRVTALLGPNGAGKTTTLRILLGLAHPDSGTATIDGYGYRELANPSATVGALLDGDFLHPARSGRAHLKALAMLAGVPDRRVDQVLETVELGADADRKAGSYSQGMRRRLGLATALLADPPVLVADEPQSGLDPQGIRWLRELLRSLAEQGRTVLLSSHLLGEVSQMADEVIIVDRGRLIRQGTLTDLVSTDEPAALGARLEDLFFELTTGLAGGERK